MRHDVEALRASLQRIATNATAIAAHLEDLDTLAYDRTVGEKAEGTNRRLYHYGDEAGDLEARQVLRYLTRELRLPAQRMELARANVFNLFAGPGADTTMRGTLISAGDFAQAKAAQQRRVADPNAYVPVKVPALDQRGRMVDPQPRHPGEKAG